MFLFAKTSRMVSPGDALPGRDERMVVPARHEVLGTPLEPPFPEGLEQAVFGLGCFWGAERVFWRAPGVYTTAAGYAGGYTPNPNYQEVCTGRTGHTEAVLVVFDPEETSYEELLRLFWENHDPTQAMRQGNDVGTQYRSGIYVTNDAQKQVAQEVIREIEASKTYASPIVTEVAPLANYSAAEAYHQDYFLNNPNQGYCAFVVGPKVEKFQKTFASRLKKA
jgi:peptide-methionine (S)-S-oxide reductase